MRVCSVPGCPTLYPGKGRHCTTHTRAHDKQRGKTYVRGYDNEHMKLRSRWAEQVATGTVTCARCRELIQPDQPWDLGHDDTDRTRYNGPEHATCNRSTAGRNHRRPTPGG